MTPRTTRRPSPKREVPRRRTQADRRARTRTALLETAARGLSRNGYGNLQLERVASEAGYTRGALYHLFANKEALALAVVEWVDETWWNEVGARAREHEDPAEGLIAIARAHAVLCRRDIARVVMVLGVEFSSQDHPVGRAVHEAGRRIAAECARLITGGRKRGTLPPGPSARSLALALMGGLEGATIYIAGRVSDDEAIAERVARGVLGLPPAGQEVERCGN